MINFIVLDNSIAISKDSMPTGFKPVALVRLPYWISGQPFDVAVMTEIANTIVYQNCDSGKLPVNWCDEELPMDRYQCLEITDETYEAYKPFIPTLEQTKPSYQIWLDDEPVAFADGTNGDADLAITGAKNLGWLDNRKDYKAVETKLTELRFGKSPLINIF